jgi:hypothetical protein
VTENIPLSDDLPVVVERGRRRPRGVWLIAGIVAVLTMIALSVAFLTRTSGVGSASASDVTSTQTAQVADITVEVTPQAFQAGQLVFTVVLDTHSGSLDGDLQSSSLTVDGSAAGPATWSGAEPGGHHREGLLTFDVGESPAQFTLTINGLPAPLTLTWPASPDAS